MVKELDLSCLQFYTNRIQKAMTRATHNGLTVGFEWEIPLTNMGERGYYPEIPEAEPFGVSWARAHGFNAHNDSGGREMGSPVFNNIATARRFARWLQESAEATSFLATDDSVGNCGIHVHVTDDSIGHIGYDQPTAFCLARDDFMYSTMSLLLNREENREWLWDFSGRREIHAYSRQAKVTGWDVRPRIVPHNPGMMKYNSNPAQAIDPAPTFELRLWGAGSDRLIPAIEFGHSLFRFVREWADGQSTSDRRTVPSAFTFDTSERTQTANERLSQFIPRIHEYMQWLNGTKGYRALKEDFSNYSFPA